MSRRVLAVALAVAAAMPVWAENQNGLTPTDILGAGEITATAQLSAALGQGKLSHPVVDLDIDSTTFQVQLSAAVGLGLGFEVELGIPYQFSGITKGDGTWLGWDTRTEEKADGFGDLTLAVNYRILKEDAALPQWIAGAIVVMPSGNDKRGDTSWEVSGVTIQDGKRGGIGDGVWKYGLQTAVSKRFGLVEPYAGFRYIFGGDRKRNDVDEERARRSRGGRIPSGSVSALPASRAFPSSAELLPIQRLERIDCGSHGVLVLQTRQDLRPPAVVVGRQGLDDLGFPRGQVVLLTRIVLHVVELPCRPGALAGADRVIRSPSDAA